MKLQDRLIRQEIALRKSLLTTSKNGELADWVFKPVNDKLKQEIAELEELLQIPDTMAKGKP